MMTIISILIGLIFLLVISFIDVGTFNHKNGMIPSSLTTLYCIVCLVIGGQAALYPGILALLIAVLFTDLDIWAGLADFKVFAGTGLLIGTIQGVLVFAFLSLFFGFVYKAYVKVFLPKYKLIPYIPVFFFSYLVSTGLLLYLLK